MSSKIKPILLIVFIAGMLVAVATLPVREWLSVSISWIESHRTLAWLIYIAAYTAAAVLVIPSAILTLAAGFIFGVPIGVILVSVASLTGAAAAFLVGRFLARDWVTQRIADFPSFRALDKATRNEGFIIVLLSRLSPLFPFNLLNYAFGLTAVRFRDYALASWIGMAPAIVLYVYIGSATKSLADLTGDGIESGVRGTTLFVVGLIATLLLTVFVTRIATKILGRHLQHEAVENPESLQLED